MSDQNARSTALDTERSFIVQAPAGSGKTEVLTQRFLALLATVEHPEQVLAITFTRKAASEMKRRVLDRLQDAVRLAEGEQLQLEDHVLFSTELAAKAMQHAKTQNWSILDNPQRLNINTIDTLNASLVRQMPYLSRLGGQLNTVEDALPLYAEAAEKTIALLDTPRAASDHEAELLDSLRQALLSLDGRSDRLQTMLESMLAQRDQWLRFSARFDQRQSFVEAMRRQLDTLLDQLLEKARSLLADEQWQQLVHLARFASGRIDDADHALHALAGLDPAAITDWELAEWRIVAEAVLTKGDDPNFRKQVNKNDGFVPKAPEKQQVVELLTQLGEHPDAETVLTTVKLNPPSLPDDDQLNLLFHLGRIVRRANTELFDLFSHRGELDFIGIAEQARVALGSDEKPTDLALHMDYRLQHILMDEFQDTSNTQYMLLRSLLRGWSPGDGRSLFLVGDPMQSIYRFREAEVGLFSRIQAEGMVGDVPVQSLYLQRNFRSNSALVNLFNSIFPQVMAEENVPEEGAVAYASATAGLKDDPLSDVLHLTLLDKESGAEAEAAWVVDQVQSALDDKLDTIAILVRGRGHATEIVEALKQHQIAYQGIDMDPLQERQVVQDLHSITRALMHPGDRVAWLAILRMPGLGITMADLTRLVGHDHKAPVLELVGHRLDQAGIDSGTQQRLRHFLQVMHQAVQAAARGKLRDAVYACWLDVGGARCLRDSSDTDDAEAYLGLLESVEASGDRGDLLDRLDHKLKKLYAAPQPDQGEVRVASRVQLMTVHKAKGLEFDAVILPGLHRPTGSDSPRLLEWLEQDDGFLAAAYQRNDEMRAPGLYEYIRAANRRKADYEVQRILYVAATRARKRLYIPLTVSYKKGKLEAVGGKSMLALLWPALQSKIEHLEFVPADADEDNSSSEVPDAQPLLRFTQPPEFISGVLDSDTELPSAGDLDLPDGLGDASAQAEGTALHFLLEMIHNQGQAAASINLDEYKALLDWVLLEHDVPPEALRTIGQRVLAAARRLIENEQTFERISADGKSRSDAELVLLERDGASIKTHIIDRVYTDAEGTVKIIDYKFTHGNPDENQQWQEQLQRYHSLWARMEPGAQIETDILAIQPPE